MIVLGLIPARGGSKGILGKNERSLGGRTLIERAAETARASGVIDRLVLTTDSDAIAALGAKANLEVLMRPPELAQDDSPMLDVVVHAVNELERNGWHGDAIAILQPTQPLRQPEHIREAARLLEETGASSVVSVVAIPHHYSPQYAMRIEGGRLRNYLAGGEALTRRQDAEDAYSRDGTIYLVRSETLRDGGLYGHDCRPLLVAPDESLNLDTPEDWAQAELRIAR